MTKSSFVAEVIFKELILWFERDQNFHSRLPKTTLKDISFILLILLNNIRFASYARRLSQKRIALKNCIKNQLKTNYVEFHIHV